MGEERLRGVLEPRGEVSMACRSTKELTVPVTPRLRTSHRSSESRSTSFDELDGAGAGPYVPLAERIRRNNEEGPRGKSAAPVPTGPYVKPALTAPKTPDFSSFRRKETQARGFAASEAEQLEEMKRRQFKARPVSKLQASRGWREGAGPEARGRKWGLVADRRCGGQLDRRVLESCGDLGVPKLDKKPLTNPRSPVAPPPLRTAVMPRRGSWPTRFCTSRLSADASPPGADASPPETWLFRG